MGFISVDLLYVLGVHLICNCIVSLYLFEVYMDTYSKAAFSLPLCSTSNAHSSCCCLVVLLVD